MSTIAAIRSHAQRAASVVRLTPFDTSTPTGRSLERYRRVGLGAAASAAARIVSIMTSLVSIPLTLHYLGVERYGLWLTISSLIAMLGFADLGLNNGLITAIADAHGRGDEDAARECVSSAFLMLMCIAAILSTVFFTAYPFVDWARIFNVSSAAAAREAGPAMAVFTIAFLVNIPLGLAQRVHIGYQETFASSAWQAVGSLLGLVGVLLAITFKAGLPWLVAAMAGAPALAALLNNVSVFFVRHPSLRPRLRYASLRVGRGLATTGMLYLMLQLVGALAFQADTLVVAHFLGTKQVPQYAVPMRLFMLVPTLLSFVLDPLWPAYGEAIARREVAWVRRTFARTTALTLLVTVPAAIVLTLLGTQIIHLWVGPSITPPVLLLVGFGLWIVVNGLSGSIAMLLNAARIVRFQAFSAVVMGLSNVALSVFLVRRIGVAGPVFGSLVSVALFTLLPSAIYVPSLFASWARMSAAPATA